MIAFVRSLTSVRTDSGSMLSVSSRMSAKTGVAPVWTITFAVAGHVSERRDHLVAGPDPERDEREVERGGARRDREHVLRLEVVAHARLELGGARAGRQPAGTERRRDRLDLRVGDRGRLEREEFRSLRGELPASAVTKRMRSAAAFARASASSRDSPAARTAPARSAPRRSGAEDVAGLAVDPHPLDALEVVGHLDALEHARRGDEEAASPRRRPATCVESARASAAERGVDREAVQVDAGHGLRRARRRGRRRAARRPRSPAARRRRRGAGCRTGRSRSRGARHGPCQPPSRAVPGTWLGQTCASATPNAGGSATTRSVTASAVNTPSTEKPTTVTSGPSTSSSTSASPLRATLRARSIASGELRRVLDERQPLLALPVGRLHDDGAGDRPAARRRRRRPTSAAAARRPRRAARAGGACSSRAPPSPARSDAAARAARRSRAATPTGQSVPGEMIPSISSAAIRRSIAGSSSVERMQRRSAKRKPGRGRVAVDDGDPEAARARRLEQPELCGTGA